VVITIGKVQARESYDGDDGYSSVATEETSDVELKAIRLRRPKISAGRRACLKDSKLMYRRRRRDIREHGYRGYFLDDDQYDEVDDEAKQRGEDTEGDYFASDTNDEQTDNELHHRQRHPRQGGETASDLNEVFATMPKQHSFRQRRRRKRGGGKASTTRGGGAGNDESYQRFQAACHAMMLNIQTSEARGALPSIEVPSKRWTRSKAHVAAAEAQQQTDVYRYKTSGFVAAGRKKSNKNAALLLSYGYFQKNQEAFVMDKGATWLTHLPAKQAKRSKGNTYYFQNMKELPQMIQQSSSFDNNRDDSDGNESTSTLAMRKPGPQKFNRLVAYVQHRLIEKEKEEQQQENQQLLLLDGDQTRRSTGPGQSRTRELAESIETPTSGQATPSRIQQMADSFEGKGGTPRMKLKRQSDTPFSGLTQSSMGSNRRRRGKSRYVPRMRLREFAIEGSSQDDEEGDAVVPPTPLPRTKLSERFSEGDSSEPWLIDGQGKTTPTSKSSSPPRKMKLRDSIAGQSEGQTPESSGTSRTREMALALEGESSNNHGTEGSSKFQQIRDSLEPKNATPKMKLRGEFDRIDEKKAAEDDEGGPPEISRSSVGRLSKQFSSPLAEEQLEDFNRPSRKVVHEFSKHIDPRIFEEMQQMEAQDQSSSYGKFRGAGSEKRQSSVSNVSEFFARMREEQQQQLQQPQKQQQGAGKQGNDSFSPADSDKRQSSGSSNVTEFFARIRGEQQQQQQDGSNMGNQPLESVAQPSSPAAHSDAISDLTKESNISGLWNRGRSGISTLTSNLNTIAENQTHKGKSLLSPEVIGRATSGLFNTFRSVPEESEGTSVPGRIQEYQAFQSTQDVSTTDASQENQWEQQDQQQQSSSGKQRSLSPQPLVKSPSMDSHEALEALRGYRKNRASMSPEDTDTASQASSFHPLPDQIREVVQNSGGKSVPPPRYVSPNQSSAPTETTTSPSELSAEQYKRAHQKFLENSANHEAIIDTDDQSLVSNAEGKMDPQVLASLMMSPDILQKRLKQAIGSVEQQRWEQVLFLINANPWLAEMKELTTNQYLLHKLAFFGMGNPPAPMSLSEQLVERFPAAVHKFDQDGNVPLHLASASGNVGMIKMLGDKFSSGASIRNEDGMLPLHFAIASFANFDAVEGRNSSRPMDTIKTVLKLFPQAVAIADNDGNLPLHVAAEFLRGGVGVDIVYLLMDEAERQLEDPYGARFRNKVKIEEMLEDDERSEGTMSTLNRDDSSIMETELQCTMVLNDFGETPLLAAIRGYKGWEMIEALVSGPGGRKAALKEDSDKNNALHLLVGEFQDATAAMVSAFGR
jgi:ankyrin repeat protein